MDKKKLIICWLLQVVAAVIFGQTLYFKFSGSAESIHIFTVVGMEPCGRYASGVVEAVAVVLLLIPQWAGLGALVSLGVISGALLAHLLTPLGIEVLGDGCLLFGLAVSVFLCSVGVLAIRHRELREVIRRMLSQSNATNRAT